MENVSRSRSRSLGRQRASSQEGQRVPSGERQRTPSTERQRTASAERRVRHENQSGSFYSGGITTGPPHTVKSGNPVSSYLQRSTGEHELSLSQGQESSRRYATFLMQDGLLSSDLENFNTAYNRCVANADKSGSQTSVRLDSPNDEIAQERLGIPKRRPATTPAALFHLPSSKSHPGPGIACNFDVDINLDTATATAILSKPSTTSLDEEVAVFQNGLNDVTHQLEIIQTTQGSILKELADDIEALQSENTYLRGSRNRLQCTNDNLLKVVQDLTKELSELKKSIELPPSTSNKSLVSNKTPQDILKGLQTILKGSCTSLCPSEQKPSPKAHQKDSVGVSSNSDKLKSRYPVAKKSMRVSKTSYGRDSGQPRSKTHQSSRHNLENQRRSSSAHQMKIQNDDEETDTHISAPRRQQRRPEGRRQNDYDDNDDSDSDEYYSSKKKKKNKCFSFGRKRSSRDRDRDRDRNRRRDS